ncbi:hypothetical protein Pelo_18801 [Pelomyxa schiedti]|nr:hypothetical protein Pelo_18801 [Pelomyxa schiedti]
MGQSLMGDGGGSSSASTHPRFAAALDARSQLVALATSSHPRCGAPSAARALWLPGSPFASPTRSFLHTLLLDTASFALVLSEAHSTHRYPPPAGRARDRALVLPLSHAAGAGRRGGRGAPEPRRGDREALRPRGLGPGSGNRGETGSVCADHCPRVGARLGDEERLIGFADQGVEEGPFLWVGVSKWMDWAVALDSRPASLVIVRLLRGDDDSAAGTDASRRVRVPLDALFTCSELVFPSCFRDELLLIGYQASEGRKKLLGLAFVVVDLRRSFQTGSLCVTASAIIADEEINHTLTRERECLPPLFLKKRDGSGAFVLSLPLSDLVQVDSSTGQITHLACSIMNGVPPNLTQLNQSVFCAHCMPGYPNSLCELWDCHNTTRPLKTVSVPECRQVMAGSGFLFIVTGDRIQVLEPLSGFVVLTITFPPKRLLGIAHESVL